MKAVRCSCICSCAPKLGQTFANDFTQSFMRTDIRKPRLADSYTSGDMIWTDGTTIYNSAAGYGQFVLNNGIWMNKTWKGRSPSGDMIWTDGSNIYYSDTGLDTDYVLNGDTWEPKIWNILLNTPNDKHVYAPAVWTDGVNIYHTYNNETYILNAGNWEYKKWSGDVEIQSGSDIWTDGTNIYSSTCRTADGVIESAHYVLNGDTWEPKTWNIEEFRGADMWTDGVNIYCSGEVIIDMNWTTRPYNYILRDGNWETINIGLGQENINGCNVWTDGTQIYHTDYSYDDYTYRVAHTLLLPSTAKLYQRANGQWIGPCTMR